MLKNRELVFEKAEEMAEKYRQKLLAEVEGVNPDEIPTATEEPEIPEETNVDDRVEETTETETTEAIEEETVTSEDTTEDTNEMAAASVEE